MTGPEAAVWVVAIIFGLPVIVIGVIAAIAAWRGELE
jgi:hypothetical protein